MIKRVFLMLPALILAGCTGTEVLQQPGNSTGTLLSYAEIITPELLQKHLEVIAHDSLMGRDTGSEGERLAAEYLIKQYRELGVAPKGTEGFRQPFILNAERTDSLVYRTYSIAEEDTTWLSHTVEAQSSAADFIRLFGGLDAIESEIVFGGFGVNDLVRNVEHLDADMMHGKWVLIFEEIPYTVNGDTLISPQISNNERIGNLLNTIGADGVLIIPELTHEEYWEAAAINSVTMGSPEQFRLQYLDESGRRQGFTKAFTVINPDKAAGILGFETAEEMREYRKKITGDITDFRPYATQTHLQYQPYDGTVEIESNNILAYIEGGDSALKDETIVLLAHYDHIGIGMPDEHGDVINNGADDNGSGTVALLSIATALQAAADEGLRPARSVLFLHVSAEEKGLLGSRYYSDHPVIPIEQTVAAFNADMIGRSDNRNISAGDTDYVYLIGGDLISSDLDEIVQQANAESVNIRLDRFYNDLTDPNQLYRRSDHWNFGRLEVPFVFFFTGLHDDYHRPGDTVDKIDFKKLSDIARLIHASTVTVANSEDRPEVDNQEFIDITRRMAR